MKNNYSGNAKPFILALCHSADAEKAKALLEELDGRGLQLCVQSEKDSIGKKARKACGVIVLLSGGFASAESLQNALLEADGLGRDIVPVYLDGTQQSEIIKRVLFSKNAVDAAHFGTAEELADRLMTAEVLQHPFVTEEQKKAGKIVSRASIAAAAAVVIAAGIFVAGKIGSKDERPQELPADTAVFETLGLTEEELAEITYFALAGDIRETENPYSVWDFLVDERDGDQIAAWRRMSDGSLVEQGSIKDLSFLQQMPNLQKIVLVNQTTEALPDLSVLKNLREIEIWNCGFRDIEGLRGSTVESVHLTAPVKDLSPLSGCPQLKTFHTTNGYDMLTNLEGLKSGSLIEVQINDEENLKDISALADCPNIKKLELVNDQSVRDMSFLGSLTGLEELYLEACDGINDVSGLADCRKLKSATFQDLNGLQDLSCLSGLPNLVDVKAHCPIPNLDFLKGHEGAKNFSLAFSRPMNDYSGLAAIGSYNGLHVNLSGGSYALVRDYLADKSIQMLQLYNIGAMNLSELPRVNNVLMIMECKNIRNLEGLDQPEIQTVDIQNCPAITSLSGIESLPSLGNICIRNCSRLTDYEALYNKEKAINNLRLEKMFSIPDLSRIDFSDYYGLDLRYIDGISDISFMDGIRNAAGNLRSFSKLELVGLDVKDLSFFENYIPVGEKRVPTELIIPPELADQAEALKELRVFDKITIEYPEEGWENDIEVEILSMDDLDTLSPMMLEKVRRFMIFGDIVSSEWPDWDEEDGQYFYDAEGNKVHPGEGIIKNLDRLSKLKGLRELNLNEQPVESLDGIQNMENLERLYISDCEKLKDLSPLFWMTSLREMQLGGIHRDMSLQGIRNLYNLERLEIQWSDGVTDLTPLLDLPNLQYVRVSADMEEALASLEGHGYSFELEVEGQ